MIETAFAMDQEGQESVATIRVAVKVAIAAIVAQARKGTTGEFANSAVIERV